MCVDSPLMATSASTQVAFNASDLVVGAWAV
jgi:hypothetical protein